MATTHQGSPGTGMRVGPFVLDIGAMGSRRRAADGDGAPADVPERASAPTEPVPAVAALTFLERRAILDAERLHDDDLPPVLPDHVEDEVVGILDDLLEEAAPGPVAPAPGVERPGRRAEPAVPVCEPTRPSPAEGRDARRSPLTPRAPLPAGRDVARFPSASSPATGRGGVPSTRALTTGGQHPDGASGASGSYRATPGGRRVTSRSGTTGTFGAVGSRKGGEAPSAQRSGAVPRVPVDPEATDAVRATVARGVRPVTGRHAIVRPASGTVRRVPPVREAPSPGVARAVADAAREWAPARNVRDAQARVAAARAEGERRGTRPVARAAPPVAYTPRSPQYDLRVRVAIMADREACGAIDSSYVTDSVWQLDTRQDENEIRIGLRQISLPKPMAATEPMDVPFVTRPDALWLVAEELEVPPAGRETTVPTVGTVVGFLTARIEPRREMVYLSAVAVAPDYRRQRLGSALVEHMRRWAAREGVPEITADVSAKNAPALRLLQRHGFRFCGYSDRLYRNGEVALFLAMAVR